MHFHNSRGRPASRFLALMTIVAVAVCVVPTQAEAVRKTLAHSTNSQLASDNNDAGLISDTVDDRAIRALISKQAELLLPDAKESLVTGFDAQLERTETKLRLPRIKSMPLEPHEVYPSVTPSVLVLSKVFKCGRCTRWHDRSAGAFVLTADGAIVTNYHVVEELKSDERALVATSASGKVYVVKEILAADKLNDIAILKLEIPDGDRLQPAKIAERAFPGEDVYAISHPASRFFTLTKGVVSRNAVMHSDDGPSKRVYITAEFAKGSSGSPVFNSRGEVVGMVSSTQSIYYTETPKEQKNLQMVFRNCVPASAIHGLLK